MNSAAAVSVPGKPAINPWFIAGTVTLATFMELLDTSIANVALPNIAGGLSRSFDEVTWILTTYLVANAVILPMSAWLSRVLGRKTYYLGCVALFTLTSLFCGLAPTFGIMLSSRVLQGLAGGGLAPVSQAILVDTFPAAKRASAFALYTIVVVTAPAVGPVLGGWITDNYSWRWIFFINIPIGILAFFLSSRLLKDPPEFEAERASLRASGRLEIDGIGIALIAIASATLEVALDRGQIEDWFGSSFITWMLTIAVVGWIATVAWEIRHKEPVIDFRLLASRNFAIAAALFLVFGIGLFGSTTLIPQLLQTLYGYRAIDAGLVLGPGALVITFLAPVAAQLIQRQLVSARVLLAFSLATVGAAMWYYSTFTLSTDYNHYALARVLQGLGYGFFFVPVNVLAYSQLRPDQNNRASSLTNLFRNWGGSFGIAFVTTMAERRRQFHQHSLEAAIGQTLTQIGGRIEGVANYLVSKGFSYADASTAAPGYFYRQLERQVSLLSFMDIFRAFAWLSLAALPLLLLVRNVKSSGKPPAAH
ncbi:MAG TPA: DHA2 family efflux MFS transporter permease subunit [Candidatus Angelobacter sp.]|nr:DHA2 family efflux MFS transporter permease subunit [Candidatus Angelobacter sp.]